MPYDVERGVPVIHIGSSGAPPSYPDTCGTTVTYPNKPAPQHHSNESGIVAKCTKFFCSIFALGACLCFLLILAVIITCIVLAKNLKD